ncbi:MAG: beta-propeller domain-containing protein [Porticoccaceae bacterium]|nr:beta-propeller domain-containing protein [Porticoccaceae bacterium]
MGKPNEDLYGVRSFGKKLYLVTFECIDPLYVLDLSNPLDPLIAGGLEVTGFSGFLHPVSDDLLLGLGEGEEGRLKLELFNVSSMDGPIH